MYEGTGFFWRGGGIKEISERMLNTTFKRDQRIVEDEKKETIKWSKEGENGATLQRAFL